MSSDNDSDARIVELVREAADARSQLKEGIEALAYKVSPENLKQEAIEATGQAAREVKVALKRWGGRAVTLTRNYPVLMTATVGFGGLLFVAFRRRSWRLMVGAVACGTGALALGLQTTRRRAQPPLTGNALQPYTGDWHALPSAASAPGLDATSTQLDLEVR